jgi:hypothetical protein
MSDELPDPVETRARLFESMAAQIRLNKHAKFGGALLAIPPGDGTEPFSFITFNQDEAAIFWSIVQTLGQMAQSAMEQASRGGQGFGRR